MLVFPFGGDEEELDQAAAGLGELNSVSVSVAMGPFGECGTAENDERDRNKKAYSRVNSIIIRKRDKVKLTDDGWLNDTLIDFWMEWYVTY